MFPYSRSFEWLNMWSMRALHWKPSRGTVAAKSPSPVTGVLHGMLPTPEEIGSEGEPRVEQSTPAMAPAVTKLRTGEVAAGYVVHNLVEILFGWFCCMKLTN